MSLNEKWTAARERSRQEREALKVEERRYAKARKLEKLGVQVKMVEGYPDPALTEDTLDAMLAAENQRRAELYQAFVHAGTVSTFWALGVQVLTGGDQVYTVGVHDPYEKTNDSRLLGPLAGAEAKVTDGTSSFSWGKAMIMPVVTAPLARKETADALIIFRDGTTYTAALDGSRAVREARKQCVQFNVLAGSSPQASTPFVSDPASKLQKLQELRDAGLLTQEEYEAKRTEVINSI
jgi:Short C-terminal domain